MQGNIPNHAEAERALTMLVDHAKKNPLGSFPAPEAGLLGDLVRKGLSALTLLATIRDALTGPDVPDSLKALLSQIETLLGITPASPAAQQAAKPAKKTP